MKIPADRSKFMDELRTVLEDVHPAKFQRSYLSKRNVSNIVGRDAYVEYTEEDAPQLLDIQGYGKSKKVCLEFSKDSDCLEIYVDGEYYMSLYFDIHKNKTAFAATVAVWVERILN